MKDRMDKSEQLVDRYLRSLGHESVIYEPDGNIPPDFLVDGRIAVEVRRLNQNFTTSAGENVALEKLSIPLWKKIKALLPTLGPSIHGESWYIGISFHRQVEPWRSLEPKIRKALPGTGTYDDPHRQPLQNESVTNRSTLPEFLPVGWKQ